MRRLSLSVAAIAFLLVVGVAAAQTTPITLATTTQNVKVTIPQLYTLTVDATNIGFDFTSSNNTVSNDYPEANLPNYQAFLGSNTSATFSPTTIADASGSVNSNKYSVATVLTNSRDWTLEVGLSAPISVGGTTQPLFLKAVAGSNAKASSGIPSYSPLSSSASTTIATTNNLGGGAGKSTYNLYYALQLTPAAGLQGGTGTFVQNVTLTYTLTAP